MAITAEQQEYLTHKIETFKNGRDTQALIKMMVKCQDLAVKSGWAAFGWGWLYHGGGFFYLDKFWLGLLCAIIGYGMCSWAAILIVTSALSYIWPDSFAAHWWMVLYIAIVQFVFGVITAIVAGAMAPSVRQKADYCLYLLSRDRAGK